MKEFKNIGEVMDYFKSEDRCRDTIEKMRWPSGRIVCPYCNCGEAYRMSDMRNYKCRDKKCGRKFTVTVGTVFEATKLPLSKWFIAMYLVTAHKKGISSHQLARDLGIGQKAGWFLLSRIRHIMASKSILKLDNIVEVDETYVGGKFENMTKGRREKYRQYTNQGYQVKVPVMGLIERDGNARFTVIGKNNFKDIVRETVNTDAMLVTDSHLGYQGLAYEYAGHAVVNHSINQFKDGVFHTNSIEGAFSHFKRMIFGIYHQVSPKHLHRYCDEFSHRWNSRKETDVQRFLNTLKNTEGRLKWKDLTAKK